MNKEQTIWNGFNLNELYIVNNESLTLHDDVFHRRRIEFTDFFVEIFDYKEYWRRPDEKTRKGLSITKTKKEAVLDERFRALECLQPSRRYSFNLLAELDSDMPTKLFHSINNEKDCEAILSILRSIHVERKAKLRSDCDRIKALIVLLKQSSAESLCIEYKDGYKDRMVNVRENSSSGHGTSGNYHNEEQTRFLLTMCGNTKDALIEFNLETDIPRVIVYALDKEDLIGTEAEACYWECIVDPDFPIIASRHALGGLHDYLLFMMEEEVDWVILENEKKCTFPGIGDFIQNFYEG